MTEEGVPDIDRIDWSRPAEALELLGMNVDACHDARDLEGSKGALAVANGVDTSTWLPLDRGRLEYIKANICSDLFRQTWSGPADSFPWTHPYLDPQILSFRKAISATNEAKTRPVWTIQAYTNLANTLNYLGRPVEALETWNQALRIDPTFPMTLGNRGRGFMQYGSMLEEPAHGVAMLAAADRDLREALKDPRRLEEAAKSAFPDTLASIRQWFRGRDPDEILRDPSLPLGDSDDEKAYRRWCLDNALFLNPLNDVGHWTVAAADVLSLPTMTSTDFQPEEWIALFNQIKQEYVSARFLLYEGISAKGPHHSDKEVALVNPLDYPVYALASEKVKAAFRMSYSLFDRIALLVDDYFELGHPERRLSFKSVWYRDGERKKGLHPSLDGRFNWPLRGLHWLSKDLFEQEEGFRESLSPDARELQEIRNAIEHRMLRLHLWESPRLDGDSLPKRRRLGQSVVYRDFEAKSLRLIKLVRAAIIYTVLAMGQEERGKKEADVSGKPVLPMVTDVWEDDWKTTY